jgi:hypothetical protein
MSVFIKRTRYVNEYICLARTKDVCARIVLGMLSATERRMFEAWRALAGGTRLLRAFVGAVESSFVGRAFGAWLCKVRDKKLHRRRLSSLGWSRRRSKSC